MKWPQVVYGVFFLEDGETPARVVRFSLSRDKTLVGPDGHETKFHLYYPEEESGFGVRLYQGSHWESGDRDETFGIDRLRLGERSAEEDVIEFFTFSEATAELVSEAFKRGFRTGSRLVTEKVTGNFQKLLGL